jgi:hypothetical protein
LARLPAACSTSLYVNLLGRVETPQERSNWVGFLESHTRGQVENFFLNSFEFDRRVVDGYYANLLRRAPDSTGESGWTGLEMRMEYARHS